MITHQREKTNARNMKRRQLVARWRLEDFNKNRRWLDDGINNVNYTVLDKHDEHVFYNITVDCLYKYRKR